MLKKSLFTALLAGGLAMGANAQGFYAKLAPGYNFRMVSSNFSTAASSAIDQTSANGVSTSVKNLAGSYGAGFRMSAGVGYMFNANIGAELDFGYLAGANQTTYQRNNVSGATTTVETNKTKAQGAMFLAPSIILTTGEGKLKPFARFGVILPLGGKLVTDHVKNTTTGGITTEETSTLETKAIFTLGFAGGVGATYDLNDKFSLYGEITSNSISVASKQTKMTAFSTKVAGKEVATLNDVPLAQKEINYTSELTASSNSLYNLASFKSDKALDALREYANLSSVGIRIGVKMNFGSKE